MPRLRRRLAQRHRGDLDGLAGDGRALIGHARGIAEHHDDARKGHVEFFGDDLPERGADAGAEIDMAVEGGDRAVGGDLDEGLETACRAGRGGANDRQRSGLRSGVVWRGHQSCASATMAGRPHRRAHDFNMRAASAQIIAQRFAAPRSRKGEGCASAAPWSLMIMPLRQ